VLLSQVSITSDERFKVSEQPGDEGQVADRMYAGARRVDESPDLGGCISGIGR
jgi:hypothetical protein